MDSIFSPKQHKNKTNRILETSIRHKNSEKGPTFSSEIPERVNIEEISLKYPKISKFILISPRDIRINFEKELKKHNEIIDTSPSPLTILQRVPAYKKLVFFSNQAVQSFIREVRSIFGPT